MELSSRFLCSMIVLFSIAYKANAIQCYYCNSANNSACLNLNEYDDETRARLIPIVNCESAIPSPVAVNFFCRKIVQTMLLLQQCQQQHLPEPQRVRRRTRARLIPIVNCESAIPSPVAVNFFCRKIVQTIFHSHRDSDLRVTRGCGWVRHHRECYKADNSDHLETVCQCFNDHCNGAETVDPASATVVFLMLSACLYFLR